MDVSTLPFQHPTPCPHRARDRTECLVHLGPALCHRVMSPAQQPGFETVYVNRETVWGIPVQGSGILLWHLQAPGTHVVYTYSDRHSPTFTEIPVKELCLSQNHTWGCTLSSHVRGHVEVTHLPFTTAGENTSQSTDSTAVLGFTRAPFNSSKT